MCVAVCCRVLLCAVVCCCVLLCVAVCCCVLLCVAVCCCVLLCVVCVLLCVLLWWFGTLYDVCMCTPHTRARSYAFFFFNILRPRGVGLCMPRLVLSHLPSCLVQVHKPHPADTSTSSWNQHEHHPSGLEYPISSTLFAEIENPKKTVLRGVLEFFC